MEVWSRKWYIVYPLAAVSLGHLSLLLQGPPIIFSPGLYHNLTTVCLTQGLRLDTAWLSRRGCIIGISGQNLLAVMFAYTTCFNFVLLLVAGWGFASSPSPCTSSHVLKILFDDGLIFFSAA